jgi:hypothetical protein
MHEMAVRLFEPSMLLTVQALVPPAGFIDSTVLPASSTAAQNDPAQEIALSGVLPSISTGGLQAPAPPVGFVEVSTSPA